MKTQQHADGSFFDEVDVPSPGNGWFVTVDVLLDILSSGQDPSTYSQGGNTPVTFLEKQIPENFYGLNNAGYALLAATMMEKQGYGTFSKKDALITFINTHYDPQVGHYGGEDLRYGRDLGVHAYAVMGLASIGPVPRQAIIYIENRQVEDGGWGSVEATALAVQALVAGGGANQEVLERAKANLLAQRNPDGGYPRIGGSECCRESRISSTTLAVQALVALDAESEIDVSLTFLRSLQKPNGAFTDGAGRSEEEGYFPLTIVPALLKVSFANPYPTGICIEQAVIGMPRAGVSMSSVAIWWALVGMVMLGMGVAAFHRGRRAATR